MTVEKENIEVAVKRSMRLFGSVPEQDYHTISEKEKYDYWKQTPLTESMPKETFEALKRLHSIPTNHTLDHFTTTPKKEIERIE